MHSLIWEPDHDLSPSCHLFTRKLVKLILQLILFQCLQRPPNNNPEDCSQHFILGSRLQASCCHAVMTLQDSA